MFFFYVKLPVGPHLNEREHVFHDGLESALMGHKLGSVLGWGDSLSHRDLSQPTRLAFHRIDIEISDVKPALTLIQRTLMALDAPLGTEIHYTVDGIAMQDTSSSSGWQSEPSGPTSKRANWPT